MAHVGHFNGAQKRILYHRVARRAVDGADGAGDRGADHVFLFAGEGFDFLLLHADILCRLGEVDPLDGDLLFKALIGVLAGGDGLIVIKPCVGELRFRGFQGVPVGDHAVGRIVVAVLQEGVIALKQAVVLRAQGAEMNIALYLGKMLSCFLYLLPQLVSVPGRRRITAPFINEAFLIHIDLARRTGIVIFPFGL